MKISSRYYYWFWLIILPLVIASSTYYFTQPKTEMFGSKTVYTVLPKSADPAVNGSYEDLQATNLFIDVIKSWVFSDNLQNEFKKDFSDVINTTFQPLSMQTFAIATIAPSAEVALTANKRWQELVYREVGNYDKHADKSGGYVIYNFDPTDYNVVPTAVANSGLGFLVGFILGGFVILWNKYYRA
ncbi:hypothetical protein KJ836_01725 [Patescibacteria group bacterium]|nr:hypothetical protein [Patescibacteria group bacterium]